MDRSILKAWNGSWRCEKLRRHRQKDWETPPLQSVVVKTAGEQQQNLQGTNEYFERPLARGGATRLKKFDSPRLPRLFWVRSKIAGFSRKGLLLGCAAFKALVCWAVRSAEGGGGGAFLGFGGGACRGFSFGVSFAGLRGPAVTWSSCRVWWFVEQRSFVLFHLGLRNSCKLLIHARVQELWPVVTPHESWAPCPGALSMPSMPRGDRLQHLHWLYGPLPVARKGSFLPFLVQLLGLCGSRKVSHQKGSCALGWRKYLAHAWHLQFRPFRLTYRCHCRSDFSLLFLNNLLRFSKVNQKNLICEMSHGQHLWV